MIDLTPVYYDEPIAEVRVFSTVSEIFYHLPILACQLYHRLGTQPIYPISSRWKPYGNEAQLEIPLIIDSPYPRKLDYWVEALTFRWRYRHRENRFTYHGPLGAKLVFSVNL